MPPTVPAPRLATALLLLAAMTLAGCASSGKHAATPAPSGWPLPGDLGVVSSSFGARRGGGTHQGVDFSAPRGTAVIATADGVVTFAGRSHDYGRMVVVDHGGGWETRYAHLHRIRVEEGDRVRRGRKLGTVGHSGKADGNHLHYEVRRNGVPIDPRPTLGGGR